MKSTSFVDPYDWQRNRWKVSTLLEDDGVYMFFHSIGQENFQRFCFPLLVLLYLPIPGFSASDISGWIHRIPISLDTPEKHSLICCGSLSCNTWKFFFFAMTPLIEKPYLSLLFLNLKKEFLDLLFPILSIVILSINGLITRSIK